MSDDLIRVRWSRFVDRALAAARYQGMTDPQIEAATGVRASTFHRWKRGEVRTMPSLAKVRAFCDGIGADVEEAMTALGLSHEDRMPVEPEAPMDPDLKEIMRQLVDPNTSEADKIFIKESLRLLASRRDRRRRDQAG
jgi:transcriptional regulator with XRE-family HTH domain